MALFKKKNDGAALNSVLVRRPIQKCFPIFLLPTFIAFCIGFLYPFAKGLFLSFCNFKTTSKWTWAGLDNSVKAFADESFLHAFWYTAGFALVSLVIINILAFTVAYLLTKGIKGSNIFRTVFFICFLLPTSIKSFTSSRASGDRRDGRPSRASPSSPQRFNVSTPSCG